MPLSQTVANYLTEHGVPYDTEHHTRTETSRETARRAEIDGLCLAKSVLLEDDRGFVLAVLPANRRLELNRIRQEIGRALHLSREQDTVYLFPDCATGAIPPLGAAYGLETIVDSSLEGLEEVFFEAGDHETLVRMKGDDFLDLLENASVADLAGESPRLAAALAQRENLYDSLVALERSVTAAIGTGDRWRRRLRRAVSRVIGALEEHVAESEGANGILFEIEGEAPRLARQVDRLRRDHVALREASRALLEEIEAAETLQSIRNDALALLGHYGRHRQRGADLVFEAFDVDIGGG